ncbi:MAG: HAMP domain-containing sensor histidine kinase, partial [Campylobacterota bacterium]|nr:HAMP domain-containing sensor histidine kinase [Campylobacterota bacterium]
MADSITPEELQLLIEQTYKVEEDFKALKDSYDHLQGTIENVVEFLPNAIWILEEDGSVFLENSKAKELSSLLSLLTLDNEESEINFDESYFLIKKSNYQDKCLVSATDITEQKRKENLATMGQMAAHLSHEIRNPIGSISLLTSTLMKRVIAKNKPIVFEIQKSIYRIERIIKATLMFSKGVKTQIEPISWMKIHDELNVAISYYSYSKEIDFILPEDDFKLQGDIDLLAMLFSNFIFNAIDAIELDDEENGIIELNHVKEKNHHRFEIYDSGIPIGNKKMLFEAFKSTKEKGNGLGLILSKQIAEAHGGEVGLCKGERKGFYLLL